MGSLERSIYNQGFEDGKRKERELWQATVQRTWHGLDLIREFVEEQVVGAMRTQELCTDAELEGIEIISGIRAIMAKFRCANCLCEYEREEE
jgi:hypothetical protein